MEKYYFKTNNSLTQFTILKKVMQSHKTFVSLLGIIQECHHTHHLLRYNVIYHLCVYAVPNGYLVARYLFIFYLLSKIEISEH